jgi:hypothetical protein
MPAISEEYRDILSQNIINLLGLELLGEDKKMEILERAVALVEKRVMLRVLDELKSKDQKAVVEAEAQGRLAEYLAERAEVMNKVYNLERWGRGLRELERAGAGGTQEAAFLRRKMYILQRAMERQYGPILASAKIK